AGRGERRSCAAVIVAVTPSAIVVGLLVAGACPPTKTWFAADAIVGGGTTWIVRLSPAFVPPPAPVTTSCRLSGPEAAAKLMYWSPETTICSLAKKLVVTFTTSVLPPSSSL